MGRVHDPDGSELPVPRGPRQARWWAAVAAVDRAGLDDRAVAHPVLRGAVSSPRGPLDEIPTQQLDRDTADLHHTEFRPGQAGSFRIYITGDTLVHDRLNEIPRRYPDIDVCLPHLGATKVAGVLLTMDADQGIQSLELIRPRTVVPIHFDDYRAFKSPLDDFRRAVDAGSLVTTVTYVDCGQTIPLGHS